MCKFQAPDRQTPLKPHKDNPLLPAKETLENQAAQPWPQAISVSFYGVLVTFVYVIL